jgi:hypothetical protein
MTPLLAGFVIIRLDVALGDPGHRPQHGEGHDQAAVQRVLDGFRHCGGGIGRQVGHADFWKFTPTA